MRTFVRNPDNVLFVAIAAKNKAASDFMKIDDEVLAAGFDLCAAEVLSRFEAANEKARMRFQAQIAGVPLKDEENENEEYGAGASEYSAEIW